MKLLKPIAAVVAALAVSGSAAAQIMLSADFDTGSIGELIRIDSVRLALGGTDSMTLYTLDITSRNDPPNAIDTAIIPSSRWFHFRMDGVRNKPIFLHIQNTEVYRPFFSYDGEKYQRFEVRENLLTQTVNTVCECDTVYVAYFTPYTHRRHTQDMERWSCSPFAKCTVIGYSGNGMPMEMLTVTDTTVPDYHKHKIWIHARVHPSEAPASWYLAALVDELLSATPVAAEMRRHAIFYIVPETNPEGVIGGYSRSTPSGVNMEVNWNRPDSLTVPEVAVLKQTIERLTADRPMDVALNVHSQIAPHATYWIHTAESTSPEFFRREMLLSALTMSHTPYYGPEDQSYSTLNPKYPEGWIWDVFGSETLALTFETPYTFYRNNLQGELVSPENLAQLGHASLLALCDLLSLGGTERLIIDSEQMPRHGSWTERHDDRIFFGNSYLIAENSSATVTFCFDNLPAGNYIICKWIPGHCPQTDSETCSDNSYWCTVGEIAHKNNGQLLWEYKATAPDDILDAVMLVRQP